MTVQLPATFAELGLPEPLSRALTASGILAPFPIQSATLPDALAGRDVLGRGRTGSGKTLAFTLPVLTRLAASPAKRRPGRPRALILAPTRELATQINATLAPLAAKMGLNSTTVFGGVGANPQISALRGGVDVLIACPGRLADHVQTGHAFLDAIEITVLDEADHMADMGFLPVVKRLLDQTPKGGQRLLFSATLDNDIDVLVKRYLNKPVTHSVDSAQSPVTAMEHHVLHIEADQRLAVLTDLAAAPDRTIVFTRTKHGAKKLTRQLVAANIPAVELHGNLAQNARARNLAAFAAGQATTLVATDIAARGIHVDDVTLVVHADPPTEHKAYLHRSGRTARAGAEGMVITLMTDEQQAEVRDLTRKAGIKPTTTRIRTGDGQLARLVPGERVYGGLPANVAAGATEDESSKPRSQARTRPAKPAVKQGGRRQSAGQAGGGEESSARKPSGKQSSGNGGGRSTEGRSAESRQQGAKKTERGQSGVKQGSARQGGAAARQGGAARQRGPKPVGASTALSYSTTTPTAVVRTEKPARSGAVAMSEAASRRMGGTRRASGAGRAK
jgi:superfamily II DNA/RNA helicase